MRARLLYEIETPEAGFRITEAGARVEFEVTVGAAIFSARLTQEQADEIEEALRRRRFARSEPSPLLSEKAPNTSEQRRLRAAPWRVTTEGT